MALSAEAISQYSGVGSPLAATTFLAATLFIPKAEASTPEPV